MRRRGTRQDPVTDYHDTARPGHEESRPAEILANDSGTALNRNTPSNKELHVHQTTATPTRPASIPSRFKPQHDTDGTLSFWGADLVADDTLHAEAVKYPTAPDITRYTIELQVEEGTAQEIREAMDRLCAWWQSQEAHLDGLEVTR